MVGVVDVVTTAKHIRYARVMKLYLEVVTNSMKTFKLRKT